METIIFTGDIAFSGYFKEKYTDEKIISKEIYNFLNSSKNVIANIESPITNKKVESDRPLNHVMNTEVTKILKKMNINIWNLGNNHIMDCGKDGLIETLDLADKEKIKTIGVGINKETASQTLIIGNEIKIGILSLTKEWKQLKSDDKTPGCIYINDFTVIKKQIGYLKDKVNYIVAIVHGGDEFSSIPMPYDRKKYIKLLDLGVDIVVGHHPHVVQNYEKIGNKTIFYSLGNFIFDTDYQRLQKNSETGVILKINFKKDSYDFESIGIKINRTKGTIEKSFLPIIFRNISDKRYRKIWKIAAKQFIKNDLKAQLYKNPKYNNISKLKKIKRYLGRFKHKRTLILELGRYLSIFSIKTKNKNNKELIDYIKEKDDID